MMMIDIYEWVGVAARGVVPVRCGRGLLRRGGGRQRARAGGRRASGVRHVRLRRRATRRRAPRPRARRQPLSGGTLSPLTYRTNGLVFMARNPTWNITFFEKTFPHINLVSRQTSQTFMKRTK